MTAAVLAFAAHPDDDLLFHSPDLDTGIAAGIPYTIVYVTSGHAGLSGAAAAERVRKRQRGVQDAYRLAGDVTEEAEQGEWDGRVLTLAGRRVEEYTLRERPSIRLLFMGLPDAGLKGMVDGEEVETVPAAGGLLTTRQRYDKETAVAVLEALMRRHRPTVVRVTEEFTEPRYDRDSHPDHRALTPLVHQAAARYRDADQTWLPQIVEYRDYDIRLFPVNLDQSARDRKKLLFGGYLPWDPGSDSVPEWTERTHYRRPRGTGWSAVDGAGTAHLFVLRAGRLLSWRGAGTTWEGPFELGDDLATVTAMRREDGGIQVAARTHDDRVVTASALDGDWTDLGTHDPGDEARYFGTPVLVSNADGRLQVFAVNSGGGLSSRWQTRDGDWAAWRDLEGDDLQDPCSAVLGPSGRIEVVAATRTGLTIWWQDEPDGPMSRGFVPCLAPASPVTLAVNADGRLEAHHRRAGNAAVAVSWQDADTGWRNSADIGGHAGIGQPATATVAGRIATAVRNGGGGVSVAMQTAPDAAYGAWTDLGGYIVDYPTAIALPDGELMIAAVHADGSLQQRRSAADGAWTEWETLG